MERRKKLTQNLKPSWVWAIAFGSSIGWGAFILPGDWIKSAGALGAIIGLLIGAAVMMLIAVSYGVLIKKYPVSGGEFAYAFLSAGKNWSFITGWFLALGYICIVALNASAFSLLLKYLFPSFMKQFYLYQIAGWDVFLPEVIISSAVILFFAYLNVKGSGLSGRLQFIFSIVLIAGVAVMGVYTFLFADFPLENMQPYFAEDKSSFISILVILAAAPWAYVGFDNVPQAAEEFEFSPKKAFSLIILSLLASGLVYATMIGVTAWTFAKGDIPNQSNLWLTGDIIYSSFGTAGVVILAIAICMGIFTGLNGFMHSSSRLLFAMSRAKTLPNFFSDLHPIYNTPHKSIWFVAIFTLPSVWFGREALLWIVDMSSTGVSVAYFFTCFAAYQVLNWSGHNSKKEVNPLKKSVALLGAVFSLTFLVLLLAPGSPAQLKLPSMIALVVWVILGILFLVSVYQKFKALSTEEMKYYILGQYKDL
ncbi:APC family permease [Siminovitchia acidinfaciens]|uniref:APC family permease n=1 Tax=Siminovitchia acidinfaciens TaxID=2321395 RepID=A0A429Y006_9BACI|nr:APC family permease [Siminovitchia acidinfaciens]RST74404.1 APC family permease [Siminovitchia acidinfaciens]